jgi:hypothetical protein
MPIINRGDDYFAVVTYTGNGTSQTITGLRFQPDFVWIKGRSGATDHALYDSVRGVQKRLESNTTDAEATSDNGVTAFNSNGFSVGSLAQVNTNGATYVAWCWKANGSAVTNTSGSITSQVSAGVSQGFSVATFTAPASNQSFTVGHGLGVAPKMTILKRRDSATNSNWWTWHIGLGDNTTNYLALNQTAASASVANMWGTIGRDSTVCGFNTPASVVTSATYVMYCFSEVAGFSRFGSYTGNGSADGPFVFCGFRPRYIMIKRSDSTSDWIIKDTARSPFNTMNERIDANGSGAENSYFQMDVTANGFKVRHAGADHNVNGGTYIFAAFSESPFKNSLAR